MRFWCYFSGGAFPAKLSMKMQILLLLAVADNLLVAFRGARGHTNVVVINRHCNNSWF